MTEKHFHHCCEKHIRSVLTSYLRKKPELERIKELTLHRQRQKEQNMAKRKAKNKPAKEVLNTTPLTAKNDKQREYIQSIKHGSEMVVCTGPAGTGKTFLPTIIACDLYLKGKIDKIIMSRPNVPSGRSLGHFPGSVEEKMGVWVTPFLSLMRSRLGSGTVDCGMKNGKIEFVPFEVMRGRTFDNALVILDEAQNTTKEEIKMFLTRIGEASKTVVVGDVKQSDLMNLDRTNNGLATMVDMIHYYDMDIDLIQFRSEEVVRSELCKMWVKAFEDELPKADPEGSIKDVKFMT